MSHSKINSKSTLKFAKSLALGSLTPSLMGGEIFFKQAMVAAQQPWGTEVLGCLTGEAVVKQGDAEP